MLKKNITTAVALTTLIATSCSAVNLLDCFHRPSSYNGNGGLTAHFAQCIESDVDIVNGGLSTTAGSEIVPLDTVTCTASGACPFSQNDSKITNAFQGIESATYSLTCNISNMGVTTNINQWQVYFNYDFSAGSKYRAVNNSGQIISLTQPFGTLTPRLQYSDNKSLTSITNLTAGTGVMYKLTSDEGYYVNGNLDAANPVGLAMSNASTTERANAVYSCSLILKHIKYAG